MQTKENKLFYGEEKADEKWIQCKSSNNRFSLGSDVLNTNRLGRSQKHFEKVWLVLFLNLCLNLIFA